MSYFLIRRNKNGILNVRSTSPKLGWVLNDKATYYFPFINDYKNYANGNAIDIGFVSNNSPTFITNTNSKTTDYDNTVLAFTNVIGQNILLSSQNISISNSTISFAFWINSSKPLIDGTLGRLFCMYFGSNTNFLGFGISNSNPNSYFVMFSSSTGSPFLTSTISTFYNIWNFVCIVISGTSVSLYINGSEIADQTATLASNLTSPCTQISIGNDVNVPSDAFQGTINGFAIYNGYALTVSNMVKIYNIGY